MPASFLPPFPPLSAQCTAAVTVLQKRKSLESAARAKKVRDLMSLMGVTHPSAAEARLERCGWDYEKAVTAFLETVN